MIFNGYVTIITGDDAIWWIRGNDMGWDLPDPAPRWKRCWPFRVLRAAMEAYRVDCWDELMRKVGLLSSGYDNWVIYAIRRGWC